MPMKIVPHPDDRSFLCVEVLTLLLVVCCTLITGTLALVAGVKPGTSQGRSESSSGIQTQSYEGMITDTHCGAKHSATIGLAAADCARVCVHGGEQFALVDADKLYMLEGDTEAVKRMAGQRVRIAGILNGDKLSVSSVAANK
jgi:hypothetical protein